MLGALAAVALAASAFWSGGNAATPKIDKAKLEIYLRYIEAYTAEVKMVIDDPTPSAFAGISRVVVHLSLGTQRVGDRMYYVTSDEQFISGSVWNLNENPFLDTLARLPATGPSFGPANAKVTIVAFSDFECPYCRDLAKTVRENLPKKYPDTVRFVFQDFPVDSIHPWARAASEAAHCVGDSKTAAFWAFHDWIFDHQPEVNDVYSHQKETFATYLRTKALEIAKAQGEDTAKVGSCIDTHATAQEVEASLQAGRALQIEKTPTLFINGRLIPGAFPWNTLDQVIQIELNRPKEIPGPAPAGEVSAPAGLKK